MLRACFFRWFFSNLSFKNEVYTLRFARLFLYAAYFKSRLKERGIHNVLRVPNRVFGIRDLAFLEPGIRDFREIWERDSGLHLWTGSGI